MKYREANTSDIPALARIRAAEWETEEYWIRRISRYMNCEHHPQMALLPRIINAATHDGAIVGFIAGHLTRRYECDGELEWINVIPEYRGTGVASELLRMLAKWFVEKNAFRICVDVGNPTARRFYIRQGAEKLNEHWLVWNDIKIVLQK